MQPHLKITKEQARAVAVVVGDPARAEQLAKMCEWHRELAYNREYRSFECRQHGNYFLVTSHGVGSAGAAICFEELIKTGVQTIIRAGTCGGLQKDVQQGNIVVATASVREDGVTPLLIPLGFPAVADPETALAVEAAVKTTGNPYKKGIVLTSDLFYTGILPSTLELYSKANVAAVEMEVATLFCIASLRGIKAAGLFAVDGNQMAGDYDPHGEKCANGKKAMLTAAIECASKLSTDTSSKTQAVQPQVVGPSTH